MAKVAKIDIKGVVTYEEEALPDLTPAPTLHDYESAVQAVVDEEARARRYKHGDALASYFNSTVKPWKDEAAVFVAWRDDVWQYAYSELSKVQGGEREQPSVADFLLELPEIVWP